LLIHIHDKNLHRVAFLDNEKPDTLHFFDDTWHRYLVEATSTFDFSVPKTGDDALRFLTEQNYISFHYDGKDYLFNIMKVVETEQKITCSCENLNLELLNEQAAEFKAAEAKSFEDYFNDASQIGGQNYSDLVIGINEISQYKRALEWTGTDTKLARLLSLVKQFDAECEFVTKLNRDGTLEKIVLNLYKAHDDDNQGVGTRRKDVTLYYGKEIKSVRRTVDKTGLYTAILPTGKDNLTISSLSARTVKDTDGKTLYYSSGTNVYAPQSAQMYPAQIGTTTDKWILLRWSYDTDNAETLYSKALAKLKEVCVPAITYEAEGTLDMDIGDTVIINDDKFSPTLLLEARVSEQEISFADPTKNKNVFANFRALENQLSSDITSRLGELIQAALPYTAEILSSGGTAFKNSVGSTTLTARVLKGDTDVTSQYTIKWYKDDAETSTGKSLTVYASSINDKSIYKYEAVANSGEMACTAEITIINADDGIDATLIYIHSSSGTSFKNDNVNTVLTVTIYNGSTTINNKAQLISLFGSGAYLQWSVRKQGDTGFSLISLTDTRLSNDGFTFTISASDVNVQAVFNVELIV
jgi:phage minor structural protein